MTAQRILHLIDSGITHPYLLAFLEHAGPGRSYDLMALGPDEGLVAAARELGGSCTALGATGKARAAMAIARRAATFRRYDIVQTHLLTSCYLGVPFARLLGVPAVFTAHHSHEVPLIGNRLLMRAEHVVRDRLATRVVVPSDDLRAALPRDDRVRTIPHGIDVASWFAARERRDETRAQLGLSDRIVLGSVGRLYWIKNHRALLHAFARVRREWDDVSLVIVGGGDRSDLERLAAELGIQRDVHLLGPRADIKDVVAAMDAAVHPALAESFGLTLLEAAAAALPIVATDTGVARDLVDDSVGELVHDPTAEALGAAMLRLLDRRAEWSAMGQRAHERATCYSASRMVERHEQLYDEILTQ